MKLIEKLASDYANEPNSIDAFSPIQQLLMRAAFIKGFEKARDLFIDKFDWVEGGNYYYEMVSLGEEEVE